MSSEGNDVRVLIDIRVPVGGTVHVASKKLRMVQVTADTPLAFNVVKVKAPSGPTGAICAKGTAKVSGMTSDQLVVYAKVYKGTPMPIPLDPTSLSPVPDSRTPFGVDGGWQFDTLLGADCGVAGSEKPNTLLIWIGIASDSSQGYEIVVIPFKGLQANVTECDPVSGSSSGSASGTLQARPGHSLHDPRALDEETVARQWTVVGMGFGGSVSFFTGVWPLLPRETTASPGQWASEGDGEQTPRVELERDRAANVWRLTFRVRNSVIRYEQPSSAWHPRNANILTGPLGTRKGEVAPASVTVIPS
jgi:hypothetical protein